MIMGHVALRRSERSLVRGPIESRTGISIIMDGKAELCVHFNQLCLDLKDFTSKMKNHLIQGGVV